MSARDNREDYHFFALQGLKIIRLAVGWRWVRGAEIEVDRVGFVAGVKETLSRKVRVWCEGKGEK